MDPPGLSAFFFDTKTTVSENNRTGRVTELVLHLSIILLKLCPTNLWTKSQAQKSDLHDHDQKCSQMIATARNQKQEMDT